MVVDEDLKDNTNTIKPERVVKLSKAELLQKQIDEQNREHLKRVMIAYFTGEDYPGPGITEILTDRFFRFLVPLVFLFSNIYIYYFVYHFSFNENFLLIFFFFVFFGLVYHYIYFSILSGLDSLSLELYIQFYRLLSLAKKQLLILRSNLQNFLSISEGLFITYYRFVQTYLATFNTLKFVSDSFFSSFVAQLLLELHVYQGQTIKRVLKGEVSKYLMDVCNTEEELDKIRLFISENYLRLNDYKNKKKLINKRLLDPTVGVIRKEILRWRARGVVIIPRPPETPRRPQHILDSYVAPNWHCKERGWYVRPMPIKERKYLAYSRMPKGVRRKFNNIRRMRKEALERMERSRKGWERAQPYHKAYKIMIHTFIIVRRVLRFIFRRRLT